MQEEACGGADRRWKAGASEESWEAPSILSRVPSELAAWLPQEMQEEVLLARGRGGELGISFGPGVREREQRRHRRFSSVKSVCGADCPIG
jgi:hypothetical protein